MKKILLLAAFLLLVQNYGFSQNQKGMGHHHHNHHMGIQMGLNWSDWQSAPSEVKRQSGWNYGFDLAFMHRLKIAAPLDFHIGLGISNINLHNNVRSWDFNPDGTIPSSNLMNASSYKRNKLSLTYLEIPAELELHFGRDSTKNFRLAFGGYGGYCIDAHTKTVKDEFTVKYKDFDNINRWRYGLSARVSRGYWGLYGRWDLSSSFKADKVAETDFRVFSVGIIFSGF